MRLPRRELVSLPGDETLSLLFLPLKLLKNPFMIPQEPCGSREHYAIACIQRQPSDNTTKVCTILANGFWDTIYGK